MKNDNKTYKNLQNTVKEVTSRTFRIKYSNYKKIKSQINDLNLCLNQLGGMVGGGEREQNKSKTSRRKKVVKVRAQVNEAKHKI